MPRSFIRHERNPQERFQTRVLVPWWVDPYWFLVGSSIEKMVMAELVRRNVFFIYRAQENTIGGFVDPKWEADFLLPHHKIWIEVQGSYWHSLPGQIEQDALRYAALEMAGWKPVFLWEFDIRERLPDKLNEIGVFYEVNAAAEQKARDKYGTSPGLRFKLGEENLTDQLKGLRAALSKRAKPEQYIFRRRLPWERREK